MSIASAAFALNCYCQVLGKCRPARSTILLQRKWFSCSVLSQCLNIFHSCGTTITNNNDSYHLSSTYSICVSGRNVLCIVSFKSQRNFKMSVINTNALWGKLRQGELRSSPNVTLLPCWKANLGLFIWYCQNLWQTLTKSGIRRACGRRSHTLSGSQKPYRKNSSLQQSSMVITASPFNFLFSSE